MPLQNAVAAVTSTDGRLQVHIHDRHLDTLMTLLGSFVVQGSGGSSPSREALCEAFWSGNLSGLPQTFEVARMLPDGNVAQLFAASERCTVSEFRNRLVTELGSSQQGSGSANLLWSSA